jgi:spore coat protein U-like protein
MKCNRMLALGLVSGLVLAMLGGTAPVLDAAQTTTNLDVTATVTANCTVAATPVAFGNYLGSPITANGTLTVNCTRDLPYAMALGAGNNLGTTPEGAFTRQMTNLGQTPSGFIPYFVYQDVTLTTEWGDTGCLAASSYTSGTCQSSSGTGTDQVFNVYGRTGTGGPQPNGTYSDVVVATVVF